MKIKHFLILFLLLCFVPNLSAQEQEDKAGNGLSFESPELGLDEMFFGQKFSPTQINEIAEITKEKIGLGYTPPKKTPISNIIFIILGAIAGLITLDFFLSIINRKPNYGHHH